jgi:diguanylate cyclase (GGDEF)-like protein/PAS domain S-box-containing protein
MSIPTNDEQLSRREEDVCPLLNKIISKLYERYKVDFNDYKMATIKRRVDRRVLSQNLNNLEAYVAYLTENPEELESLHHDLLIGVTNFFRDKAAFTSLDENVVAKLFDKASELKKEIRVWVPGCATGEEVFSLAILLKEYARLKKLTIKIKLFATDINNEYLDIASQGVYSSESIVDIPKPLLARYFNHKKTDYIIDKSIRSLIVFAPYNLITDPPFTNIDLISCRNALIYLKPEIQKRVFHNLLFGLNIEGYMILGPSESVGDHSEFLNCIDNKWKIYQKVKSYRSAGFNIHTLSSNKYKPRVVAGEKANKFPMYLYNKILKDVVTMGFIVDENRNLVHVFGNANEMVKLSEGAVSTDIVKIINEAFQVPLNTALYRARKTHDVVSYSNIFIDRDKQKIEYKISVHPVKNEQNKLSYYLIQLIELDKEKFKGSSCEFKYDDHTKQVISELENELQLSRESLQATLEEVETANEELQSTNEELLASNEELQSTNEELHSANVELNTLNTEHQNKIGELSSLNTDIDNLFRSVDFGVIFVDMKLRIRMFTPAIKKIIDLVEHDLGRPISHFANNINIKDYLPKIANVIEKGISFEKEVRNSEGDWYLVRIIPYLNTEKNIDGAIVTFIDTNRSNNSYDDLRLNKDLSVLLKNTDLSLLYIDTSMLLKVFSPSAQLLFNLKEGDVGRNITDFSNHLIGLDIDAVFNQVKKSLTVYECEIQTKAQKWLLMKVSPNVNDSGEFSGVIFAFMDVSTSKDIYNKLKETDELFSRALQSADIGIWSWDYDKDLVKYDRSIEHLFKLDQRMKLGSYKDFERIIHPEDKAKFRHALDETIDHDFELNLELRVNVPNKSIKNIKLHARKYENFKEKSTCITGIAWDITERVQLEHSAVEAEGRRVALDEITDGWWDWNFETDEEYLSPKFKAMFGYEDHEIANNANDWKKYMFPEDRIKAIQSVETHISKGVPYHLVVRYRHKDGSTIWVLRRGKAIKDGNGKYTRMLGTHTNITLLKRSEKHLELMAHFDSLTMLPNRTSFIDQLPKALSRAKKFRQQLAVFFIDMDNFKQVNDNLGHLAGDSLLKLAASYMKKSVNDCFIARLGGDEFAVILEGIDEFSEIVSIAQRCVDAFKEPVHTNGHEIKTSVSLGIATYPFAGETPDELIMHADMAMYHAKEQGRDKYQFFNEAINTEVTHKHVLSSHLIHAVEYDELSIVFQPQCNIKTKKIVGVEALLRWSSKELGVVSPSDFIKIAEESKLIIEIGEWALRRTCALFSKMIAEKNITNLRLSINISIKQFTSIGFSSLIKEVVDEYKLKPGILILELTESSLLEVSQQTVKTIAELQSYGVSLALDDFGAGYSSLKYLQTLPVILIKIDRGFICNIQKNPNEAAIVKAIVSLTNALEIDVIAEGVETKEQVDVVTALGCDLMQGFYISKPLSVAELEKFIEKSDSFFMIE